MVRILILCTLLISFGESLDAQCTTLLKENVRLTNGQRIITNSQKLVVRGNYAYSIHFEAGAKGIRAVFESRGGEKPNKDDELIFIPRSGQLRSYRFVDAVKTVSTSGAPEFVNELKLDIESGNWLANNDIGGVTLKNNVKGEERSITLPAS